MEGGEATPFQFHKGTIRTSTLLNSSHPELYFNSIKVRLERFKLTQRKAGNRFQFHKGTIRTEKPAE